MGSTCFPTALPMSGLMSLFHAVNEGDSLSGSLTTLLIFTANLLIFSSFVKKVIKLIYTFLVSTDLSVFTNVYWPLVFSFWCVTRPYFRVCSWSSEFILLLNFDH